MSSEPLNPLKSSTTSQALSKRLGSLQAFQTRIAQRIAQAQSQSQQLDSLLSLHIQGFRVLLPLSQVNELLSMPELTRLPLAKRWVLGLAVVRSEVLTVFDLGYCLRHLLNSGGIGDGLDLDDFVIPKADLAQRQTESKLLVLSKAVANQLAFTADRVIGTLQPSLAGLQAAYPKKMIPLESTGSYVKGLWRNDAGELFIELSLIELFKSPDFAQIIY